MSPLRVHSPIEADRKQTLFTSHYVTTELHVQDVYRKGFASALASGDLSCRHMMQVQVRFILLFELGMPRWRDARGTAGVHYE